jgi:uncharacterized protein YkwD
VFCKHAWQLTYLNKKNSYFCTRCGKRASGTRTHRRKNRKQIGIIFAGLVSVSLFVLAVGIPGFPQLNIPNFIDTKPSQTPPATQNEEPPRLPTTQPEEQSRLSTTSDTSPVILSNCLMASNGVGGIRINCENHDSVQCISNPPLGSGIHRDVTLTIDKNTCKVQYQNPQGNTSYFSFELVTSLEVLKSSIETNNNTSMNTTIKSSGQEGVSSAHRPSPETNNNLIAQIGKIQNYINVASKKIENQTKNVAESLKPIPPPSLQELRQIALDDINKYRTQNGLHPLTLGTARSSQIYSEELLKEGCIHHVDSRGEGPMLRYKNNGDTMYLISENIAGELGTNYGTPQSNIINGNNRMMYDDASSNWGHKINILDPEPASVSIGIAYDSQRLVMVQDFQTVLSGGYQYSPSSFQTEPEDQKFCW